MTSYEQIFLAGAVVIFLTFILWNGLIRAPLRRSARRRLETPDGADKELHALLERLRDGAQTASVLREIKKRIAKEKSKTVKATYLCSAGDVLRQTVSRKGTALRYYVKALEADPTCIDARHGMRELLLQQRRGFRLEQLYWQLLGRLDFDEHGCTFVTTAWRELAELLERRKSGKKRARALRRLLERIDEAPDCVEGSSPSTDCDD